MIVDPSGQFFRRTFRRRPQLKILQEHPPRRRKKHDIDRRSVVRSWKLQEDFADGLLYEMSLNPLI